MTMGLLMIGSGFMAGASFAGPPPGLAVVQATQAVFSLSFVMSQIEHFQVPSLALNSSLKGFADVAKKKIVC